MSRRMRESSFGIVPPREKNKKRRNENMKILKEFRIGEKENEYGLEIMAFDLQIAEQRAAYEQLKHIAGLRFSSIEADALQASISGDYDHVITQMENLLEDGWAWE